MDESHLTIGLLQMSCTESPDRNVEKAEEMVREAASRGADIVCLQELFHTIYFCREIDDTYFQWAETLTGPLIQRLSAMAADLEIVLAAPFFEKRAPGVYHNSLVVFDEQGERLGLYRKKHIPDDPGFYEKYYFTPGEDEYQVYSTSFGRIGPLICWDQWYPEAARITALKGAEILIYPTAIGTLPGEDAETEEQFLDAWQTIQRSHAIANGCFVASINRVGQEGEVKFWGHSFVTGPFGRMIGQAGGEEQILLAEIDLSSIEKQRQTWPFFRDRRIDTYAPILKRMDD
ncbi:MAG: carbon-nitrogen hydrolase [Balneolaceae bacterium]|nr:carbon-nitrogen hydrolase [Balneolaceae bacterium]